MTDSLNTQIGGATPPAPNPAAPSQNNKSKNNKANNKTQIRTSAFNFLPVITATFIKILPFALYVSTLIESLLFNDIRGFFIFWITVK